MRPYSPEQLVNTLTCPVYQFIYQFGSKKAVFMKNIVGKTSGARSRNHTCGPG